MSLSMSEPERQAFLAARHVGVLAIPRTQRGPLTVPVWYDYAPDKGLWFVTDRDSRKGRLLREGVRLSLCAQTETPPYLYVSVEGPVSELRPANNELDLRPMAIRYLGEEQGNAYADASDGVGSILVRMRVEQWLSVDYRKR